MTKMNGAENYLASCDSEGMLKIWDKRMMKCVSSIESGDYSLNCLDFEKNGKMIVAGSDDFSVKIFDIASEK